MAMGYGPRARSSRPMLYIATNWSLANSKGVKTCYILTLKYYFRVKNEI
ncbi:hypothetical protein PSM_A0438 [Pseudoalteromonas sp. SM9913]|nr:hypothetical protein PSM_A0438 [Pseudoalteromonas sp. SM9913]